MRGNLRLPVVLWLLALPRQRGYGSAVGFLLSVSSVPFIRPACHCSFPEFSQTNGDGRLCVSKSCLTAEDPVKAAATVKHHPPMSIVEQHVLSWISRFSHDRAFLAMFTDTFMTTEKTSSKVRFSRHVPLLSAVAADEVPVIAQEPPARSGETPTEESVHLKLGSEAMMKPHKVEHQEDDDRNKPASNETVTTMLHTYTDRATNVSLSGLNVPRRKFAAWVQYTLASNHTDSSTKVATSPFDPVRIVTSDICVDDDEVRSRLRELWRQRRLLSDRTEVLAVYKSDTSKRGKVKERRVLSSSSRRGGFPDLLHIYAERLSAIIEDEIDEGKVATGELRVFNMSGGDGEEPIPQDLLDILDGGLLGWLKREYGVQETDKLCAANMLQASESVQYESLQHFLEWFRSRFPYYYDRCDSCGASAKDDPPPSSDPSESSDAVDEDDGDGTFLGYVYPSKEELLGKASRTEIYQCHKCGAFTRFARYNAASSVIKNRRGRCGEYSMLLFRILRAAGHESRWVVDWADHVWAEVRLNNNWIHLDPCEAAVDQPLLYQEWGKQQTYIVAFHAPSPVEDSLASNVSHHSARPYLQRKVPLIEDVTTRYTSDDMDSIRKRRDESAEELRRSMKKATIDLEHKLNDLLQVK